MSGVPMSQASSRRQGDYNEQHELHAAIANCNLDRELADARIDRFRDYWAHQSNPIGKEYARLGSCEHPIA